MRNAGIGEPDLRLALLAVEDEDLASRSSGRLLISAATQQGVETLARRIHGSGPRARLPFVQASAGELPGDADALREYCSRALDAGGGGSMLVSAVEEMPAAVQGAMLDWLTSLERAGRPSAAVRLISGTTVSLLHRIAAGMFSAQLFYRLNVIHLVVGDGPPESRSYRSVPEGRSRPF